MEDAETNLTNNRRQGDRKGSVNDSRQDVSL